MRVFKVKPEDAGKRADVFLASHFPAFTRSALGKLFDMDLVKLSGAQLKPSYRLKPTDKVEVNDASLKAKTPSIDIPVLYEDANVIVLNKPEGVLTHAKGIINEEATVASFIRPKLSDEFIDNNRGGIVHRLDRATSGVLISAKNKQTMSLLQKQFSLRRVKKSYLAIVEGVPQETEALIDVAIERNPKRPQTFKAGSNGKTAQTHYKVIKTIVKEGREYSLVELAPATGRTHQIRVHMKYIGTPVLGDKLYGEEGLEHLYLHSARLEITIPSGQRKIFEAPTPSYFSEFLSE
jgi:23S rRNA pseudouridine1911/1915/1917 synthase